jgi:hypothetical protein
VESKPKEVLSPPQKNSTNLLTPVCNDCISTDEAANHIGENVKVIGVVKKLTTVEWEDSEPTFIDLDYSFPGNPINVVVFKENKAKFKDLNTLLDKQVSIKGLIKMHHYKGNASYPASDYPQIVLTSREQISIVK